MGTHFEARDLYEQIDLLDSAPREAVGIGAVRIGKELRRLMELGLVTVSIVGDQVQVKTTKQGAAFTSFMRGHRGRI